jgi:hypothetical protein
MEAKAAPCGHCGLGAATVPTFWARRDAGPARVGRYLAGAVGVALLAAVPLFILLMAKQPGPLFIAVALITSLAGALCAGLLLQPVVQAWVARARNRSWWTYATEWTGDGGHGSVEAQMTLVGGHLTWARGRYRAYGQPRGRRFGARAAPLAAQRRFVKWLTAEVLAGRAHVAHRRTIEWELKRPPQPAQPADGLERTEEVCLMVARATGQPAPPESDAVYTRHLTEPRSVAELWLAVARDTGKLPESHLMEHELPDWAHDLEAAVTAEVSPLVLN